MYRIIAALFVSAFLVSTVYADTGMVKIKSNYPVAETLDRLERAVSSKGMTVFTRIDHAGGAAKVGKDLRPTELLIFGNPKVGTLLMQSNQEAALDLPLKALAWQDSQGVVWLAYNEPGYLASRHGISDRDAVIEKMRNAMKAFAAAATE